MCWGGEEEEDVCVCVSREGEGGCDGILYCQIVCVYVCVFKVCV